MLVFVAAERRELVGLLVHVDEIRKPGWPLDFARTGRLMDREVALVANGPGPKLAGEAVDLVREREKMHALVSSGFCGGLQPWLQVGDIFVATEIVGVAAASAPSCARAFKTGKLLSVDRVVSTAAEKAELGLRGADAVEMEAAAVAARAIQWSIPFFAVRVVTDTCDQDFGLDFNRMRSDDGRFSTAKILMEGMRRPTVLPELIKLNKITKRAAQALGDFLADARF